MLEQGQGGDVYKCVAQDGVPIGKITRTIARRLGIEADPRVRDVSSAVREMGIGRKVMPWTSR